MKKKVLSSVIIGSESSNFLSFITLRVHHTRQIGIIFYTVAICELPYNPFQLAKSSTILLGITQGNPTLCKRFFHKVLEISNWSRWWPTMLFLHIQHLPITMIWCFLFLKVRRSLLESAMAQTKYTGSIHDRHPARRNFFLISRNIKNIYIYQKE